jgi:hypothetical protein
MTLVALMICLLLSAFGALGIASPSQFGGILRSFQTPRGLYFAAAFRVVLGVALCFAAPTSRAPELILVVGVVIMVRGVITPFFALERYRRLLDRLSAKGSVLIRGWALLASALGLLYAYALVP